MFGLEIFSGSADWNGIKDKNAMQQNVDRVKNKNLFFIFNDNVIGAKWFQ